MKIIIAERIEGHWPDKIIFEGDKAEAVKLFAEGRASGRSLAMIIAGAVVVGYPPERKLILVDSGANL